MTRPAFLTRVAGRPVAAAILLPASVVILIAWFGGGVEWWLGVIAILVASQTVSAVGRVRRYNAWAAEWQALNGPAPRPQQAPKLGRRRRWDVIIAAVLFLLMPIYLPQVQDDELLGALVLLWAADGLYLGIAGIRRVVSRTKKRRTPEAKPAIARADVVPVTWMVRLPASAPTRRSAERNLPDRYARLIAESREDLSEYANTIS